MAHRGDGERILAKCANCDSVYAARMWPNGDVQPIGATECRCGTTEFIVLAEIEDSDSSRTTGTE